MKFKVGDKVRVTGGVHQHDTGIVVDPDVEIHLAGISGAQLSGDTGRRPDFYQTFPIRLTRHPETLWWEIGVLQLEYL